MSVPHGILVGGLSEYTDEYLAPLLSAAGFYVVTARGWERLRDTLNRQFDLVLLDFPGEGVLDRLRDVRQQFPRMLVVLGPRNDRLTVIALTEGVDDYVARPFRADELIARVRAQLRRQQRYVPPPFTVGPFHFDLAARVITFDNRPLHLDLPAFTLLCVLAEAPYRAFSPEELVTLVWGRGQAHQRETLCATWQSLRQQIAPQQASYVLTGDPLHGLSLLATVTGDYSDQGGNDR
ncbi:MAG: response regulator transcription factor [Chloroflexus sp.]